MFLTFCISFTALKPSEDETALVLRVCNVTEKASDLVINVPENRICRESDITEQRGKRIIPEETGLLRVSVGKKEIKTIRIETNAYG